MSPLRSRVSRTATKLAGATSAAAVVSFAALGALGTTGCGHTESHVALLRDTSPPTRRVDVYMTTQVVERPYYEIALIQVIGAGGEMDSEHLIAALRARAQSLGCEGVIRVQIDVGYMRSHVAGVCVRYLAPGADHEPPALQEGSAPPMPPPPPQRPSVNPGMRDVEHQGGPL